MNIAQIIAEEVNKIGGQTYYVGGYVRDQFLGIENKDIDIEVHGVEPDALYEILKKIGKPKSYGKNFGIYSLKGHHNIDIALPRSEKNTGRGHRDFEIYVDPYIGTTKAIQRRDFTINAIYRNVLTDEIIDPFNGIEDIKNKIIRYVDKDAFSEDPLRVLRACQFASRFEFKIDDKTIELCRNIDISTLSKERIEEELKKALTKGKKPSIFFDYLRQMNQLDYWFKEVKDLIGLIQDPIYHPEGDVYTHSMQVLDRTVKYRDQVSNAYYFSLAALCHDFGKIVTTQELEGRVHSYKHETLGLPIIKNFISRITSDKQVKRYVCNIAQYHMKPMSCFKGKASVKATNHLFDEVDYPIDLIYFVMCDASSYNDELYKYLMDRYKKFEEIMSEPYVTGQDLIENGIKPNENFTEALSYAHKLRLAGVNKKEALVQTLSYIKKLNK